jgi:hypothetical protein
LSFYELLLIKPDVWPGGGNPPPTTEALQVAGIFHYDPQAVGKANGLRMVYRFGPNAHWPTSSKQKNMEENRFHAVKNP